MEVDKASSALPFDDEREDDYMEEEADDPDMDVIESVEHQFAEVGINLTNLDEIIIPRYPRKNRKVSIRLAINALAIFQSVHSPNFKDAQMGRRCSNDWQQ